MTDSGVLFICTGNACRSQMAEGWLRNLTNGSMEVASAGVIPAGVHPLAVQVMAEAGVDISAHTSKTAATFATKEFAYIITLCDHACAVIQGLPRSRGRIHWPFPDPVNTPGDLDVRLASFRKVRDLIRDRLRDWLEHQSG